MQTNPTADEYLPRARRRLFPGGPMVTFLFLPVTGKRAGAKVSRREERHRELTRILESRYPTHRAGRIVGQTR